LGYARIGITKSSKLSSLTIREITSQAISNQKRLHFR